jgi:hypothetical protein
MPSTRTGYGQMLRRMSTSIFMYLYKMSLQHMAFPAQMCYVMTVWVAAAVPRRKREMNVALNQ